MATKLSVNLNKVALIRNSRDTTIPDIVKAAETCIAHGAQGITVHPRPDQRHIRPDDVERLAALLEGQQDIEFNIEGNPFAGAEGNGYPGFMSLVAAARPAQATLVPDDPGQLTSDHGWDLGGDNTELEQIIAQLHEWNCRVSLFMDPDLDNIRRAQQLGADRIEFYTGPYAEAFADGTHKDILAAFSNAAEVARQLGLGINAGHDLNQDNLALFCQQVSDVAEVSIGHALITDAIWDGLAPTVARYRAILEGVSQAA